MAVRNSDYSCGGNDGCCDGGVADDGAVAVDGRCSKTKRLLRRRFRYRSS